MSVNFSCVCIIYVKIYEKMSSGGLEVSLSIYIIGRIVLSVIMLIPDHVHLFFFLFRFFMFKSAIFSNVWVSLPVLKQC